MKTRTPLIVCLSALFVLAGCGEDIVGDDSSGGDSLENPFLSDYANSGKEDTAYVNPDGIEVEVTIEGDVSAPSYKLFDAPAELGQYAVTYLRKRGEFYLESLAEDATSDQRVEWLVDEEWLTAADARIAVGHVRGALLVDDRDQSDARRGEDIHCVHKRRTHDAEHVGHIVGDHGLHKRFTRGHAGHKPISSSVGSVALAASLVFS